MAKMNREPRKPKRFILDLESSLMFDESQDEQNNSQASSAEYFKCPKKLKFLENKALLADKINKTDTAARIDVSDQNEQDKYNKELRDMTKFFQSIGNDFGKSMQMTKTPLGQLTDAVISVYESKLAEIVKRQECEVKEFVEYALDYIQKKLSKRKEEFEKLTLQENVMVKAIEQQVKLFQSTDTSIEMFVENCSKIHRNFIQAFGNLKIKYRNEALKLRNSLDTDISALQSKKKKIRNIENI